MRKFDFEKVNKEISDKTIITIYKTGGWYDSYYIKDVIKAILEYLELDLKKVYPNPPEMTVKVEKREKKCHPTTG